MTLFRFLIPAKGHRIPSAQGQTAYSRGFEDRDPELALGEVDLDASPRDDILDHIFLSPDNMMIDSPYGFIMQVLFCLPPMDQ